VGSLGFQMTFDLVRSLNFNYTIFCSKNDIERLPTLRSELPLTIHLPSFIRRPPRDNGMPVFFDTRLLALVTPSALSGSTCAPTQTPAQEFELVVLADVVVGVIEEVALVR